MCFLMENVRLCEDTQSEKKANSLDKSWVLPWLSYTNLTVQAMVMLGETQGRKGGKIEEVKKLYYTVH